MVRSKCMLCTADSRYTFLLFEGDKDKAQQYDFHFNLGTEWTLGCYWYDTLHTICCLL